MTGPAGGGERRRGYAPDFLTELFENPLEPGYADAARQRAERARSAAADQPGGDPGARWGGRWAGRWAVGTTGRFSLSRAASLLVIAAIGFLLMVAYQHVIADEPARTRVRNGLIDQINDRQATSDRLGRQADKLRDEVARQRDAAIDDRAAARLRDLEAVTGLGRVTGDGVVVRLAGAPQPKNALDGNALDGQDGNDLGRVLDRDLQRIANALWHSGAEAIAINGQRLTSTSTIRAAGDAILVDFRPLTGPYEVAAIGPADLRDSFSGSATAHTFRQLAAAFGMSFEVNGRDDLSLPAADDPQLRYARPVSDQSRSAGTTSTTSPSTVTPAKGGR